jgi:hypothetical protein
MVNEEASVAMQRRGQAPYSCALSPKFSLGLGLNPLFPSPPRLDSPGAMAHALSRGDWRKTDFARARRQAPVCHERSRAHRPRFFATFANFCQPPLSQPSPSPRQIDASHQASRNRTASHVNYTKKGRAAAPMQPAKQDAFSVSRKRAVFRLPRYSRTRNDYFPVQAGSGPSPLPGILEPDTCTMYNMKSITIRNTTGLRPDPFRAQPSRPLPRRVPHGPASSTPLSPSASACSACRFPPSSRIATPRP